MPTYINKVACRKAILNLAEKRAHKFKRVGADVYDHLDIVLLNTMKSIVESHPSTGKTIMMGSKKRKSSESIEREVDNNDGGGWK